jgi:hypothetical protein
VIPGFNFSARLETPLFLAVAQRADLLRMAAGNDCPPRITRQPLTAPLNWIWAAANQPTMGYLLLYPAWAAACRLLPPACRWR